MSRPAGRAGTIVGALAERLAADPDALALLVEGGRDLTYRTWARRSHALAGGLAARGVVAGDRVALRFDASAWSDFAVSYLGVVEAGAVAVLIPSGLGGGDLVRALSVSAVRGVVCPGPLAPAREGRWVAEPDELERADGASRPGRPAAGPEPDDIAELLFPLAPFAPARPVARTHRDVVGDAGSLPAGTLVHAWAPGTRAGQHALAHVLTAQRTTAATIARHAPERFCALVEERRAVACGLTPGVAAALVATGAAAHHDLGTVRQVVLSAPMARPDASAALRRTFGKASITEIAGPDRSATAGAPPAPPVPVAVSQDGMLWHEQLTPGSFNLPCLVRRYRGRLDPGALERALSALVGRHEPLRTTFALVDGLPRQVIGSGELSPLVVTDVSDLRQEERDAEVAVLLTDASSRPFDLVHGPLFAPQLVRLGDDDHLLVVRLHHTVFDDWSVSVFRNDLSALYASCLAGGPSTLPDLATTFGEFCEAERSRLAGEEGEADLAWWRTYLDGAPLSVQLPVGPRQAGGRARPGAGEPVRRDLPDALAGRWRTLSRELRATPFMTTLAAFAVLVARVTGQDDLVLASVVAHRNRSELEPLIGCFTKKVLVRVAVGDDPTFADLVARVRTSVLGAMAHQDPAFEAVVQETLGAPAAAHGVVPQIAVVFQGETPQLNKLVLPGIETSAYDVPVDARRERHFSAEQEHTEQAPPDPEQEAPDDREWGDGLYLNTFLILSLLANPDELALVARGVFDRPVVAELLEHFEGVLAAIAERPHRPVGDIPVVIPSLDTVPAVDAPAADRIDLRGFGTRRSRLEAGLRRCGGVADVAVAVADGDGGPRLVAFVVADRQPPPSLGELRTALWSEVPGSLLPSRVVTVDAVRRRSDGTPDVEAMPGGSDRRGEAPDPDADLLTALWSEARGEPMASTDSYWQDFSFLRVLAEARQAGLAITDEQVARCRTPEMLALALAAATPPGAGAGDRGG